jgi:Protein of unknown function (DUF1501)
MKVSYGSGPVSAEFLSRRRFLRVGALGGMLTLPGLLKASGRGPSPARVASAKSCILIVQQGGPSHIDTWDLKPAAGEEFRGPFRPIPTSVPGTQVCELLPRLAAMADRFALLRSLTQPSADHHDGMHNCLSGRSMPPPDAPYFGSVLARLRPATRAVPSYVWLQNMEYDAGPRYQSGGFLGPAYAPLRVGTYLDNPSAPGFRVGAFDPQPGLSDQRFYERRRLLKVLDSAGGAQTRAHVGQSLDRFRERAFDLVTGPEARRAFELDREPPTVRDRYGRHPLGQNLLLARRLIEAGVGLVSIHAWTGVAPGGKLITINVWDAHGGVDYIGNSFGTGTYGLRFILPRLDQAVSALLEDLEQRGLLGETLVAMLGEFGRTPKITNMGRDHWPACYSAFLAGGGVRGGALYGASDRIGAQVKDNPVRPEDFGATLLHGLGVPLEARLAADGATYPASPGQPITGIFD